MCGVCVYVQGSCWHRWPFWPSKHTCIVSIVLSQNLLRFENKMMMRQQKM